jgi:Holliday junction DNA helicase RuvB
MTLNDVVGQERAKQVLKLLTHGYNRKGVLPAVGIFGRSGLGKTHMVSAWARDLNAQEIYINGTSVRDAIAFRQFFDQAYKNQSIHYVIFVDECHNLPKKVQENMLSILEFPSILCTVAPTDMGLVRCVDGPKYVQKGDIMREELPNNISFVFATTEPAELNEPILNRLRKITLAPYTIDDKIEIAMMYLGKHDAPHDASLCESLAKRSRSIRHLKTDLCESYMDICTMYDEDQSSHNLPILDDLLGIDSDGANDQDVDYLEYVARNKVVGLDTMSGRLRVDKKEILRSIEPFLLEKGWISITGRGRCLTEEGYRKVYGDDADTAR